MTVPRPPPYRDPLLPTPPKVNPVREMWRCPICNPPRMNYQHCKLCPMCGEPNPTPKDN